MQGILPFGSGERPIVVPAAQEKQNPWAQLPQILGNAITGMVQGKIKQKFETEPQQSWLEKYEGIKSKSAVDLEKMREDAANARNAETTGAHLIAAGFTKGEDGQWKRPGASVASDINIPGYVVVKDAQGNPHFVQNKPTVDLELPGGMKIPEVGSDTAATVAGHMLGAKGDKPDYTLSKILDDNRTRYKAKEDEIDTRYGTRNAIGGFSIPTGEPRRLWELERAELHRAELSDNVRIFKGLRPSWSFGDEQGQKNNPAVTDFLNQFGGGQ